MRRLVLALSVATATAFAGPAAGQVELECLSNPLPAHCVSFAFSVDVSTVADPGMLFGPLLPGDTITGTLTLNTAIPDIDPDSGRGAYTNALECASVELADRQVAIVLSPVEPDLDPNDSDPAVKVLNDAESSGGGLTLITDAVTGTAAGLSAIDVFSIPGLNFRGLAGSASDMAILASRASRFRVRRMSSPTIQSRTPRRVTSRSSPPRSSTCNSPNSTTRPAFSSGNSRASTPRAQFRVRSRASHSPWPARCSA